jgi:hypothetical protein
MKYLRKMYFLFLWLFIVPHTYAQNEQNINVLLLRTRFIENYLFLELLIQNITSETIYVLKDYYIEEIIEDNGYLKLSIKSNKLTGLIGYDENGEMEWISLAMFHEPQMIEIRSNQTSYLTLLLNIFDEFTEIDRTKEINEIVGIKYSIQEYKNIIKIELWEKDILLFNDNIQNNFYDLGYRRRSFLNQPLNSLLN